MQYDLIIVGSNLVGKAMAAAVGDHSLRIALIDALAEERSDPRLIALNYGSCAFLKKIKVSLDAASIPIKKVHVSRRQQFGTVQISAVSLGLPALGYVIPAEALNQALNHTLRTRPGITQWRPARVTAVTNLAEHAQVSIETPQGCETLTAKMVIGADGTHSTLRDLLAFATEVKDYQQSALVTTTELMRSHDYVAYERFLEEGALAMLPLQSPSWKCATIWTAPNADIARLQALNDQDFLLTLQETFGYRLGKLKEIGKRHVFPLHFMHVKNPRKGRVLLIGNAAHTIHPLAAQGFNLALYEIAHLCQQLSENNQQTLDLLPQQPKTNLHFSDYLNTWFSSSRWGVTYLRQASMICLDLCTPLKKQLGQQLAMEQLQWL